MRASVIAIAVAAGGWYYNQHRTAQASLPPLEQAVSASPFPATPAAVFRCEGKTICHQMLSCEEATFYLRSCPGTKMDGDGIPCERSLC